ncbi:MAG: class II fructose-bisphosphatase [Anaerolineae bacterium]|nr:class II fructose-bisphosphatase [Anaerolineae bacterium]
MANQPERNLGMELVRVTEAAAMAAGRWMGRGDKNGSDQAAVDAMRLILNSIEMDGIIVIGEGEKDEAPMLFNGERIGTGHPPEVDIAVDPIDGTRLLSQGRSNALAVVALAPRGTMFNPGPVMYMEKIAVGEVARGHIDINAPIAVNLRNIARAKGTDVEDVTAVILDRPRHEQIIREVRQTGARIRLITDGDVAGSIMTALPGTGVDVLLGIGGTPEGVVSACALKGLGGEIQGRLWPRNDEEARLAREMGYALDQVLMNDELVKSDDVFFAATGITDGELLKGVRYYAGGATTHSMMVRSKSGTMRLIEAQHRWQKLMLISQLPFD